MHLKTVTFFSTLKTQMMLSQGTMSILVAPRGQSRKDLPQRSGSVQEKELAEIGYDSM